MYGTFISLTRKKFILQSELGSQYNIYIFHENLPVHKLFDMRTIYRIEVQCNWHNLLLDCKNSFFHERPYAKLLEKVRHTLSSLDLSLIWLLTKWEYWRPQIDIRRCVYVFSFYILISHHQFIFIITAHENIFISCNEKKDTFPSRSILTWFSRNYIFFVGRERPQFAVCNRKTYHPLSIMVMVAVVAMGVMTVILWQKMKWQV